MSFTSESTRMARKSHACNDCKAEIKPGDRYLSVTTMDDDLEDRHGAAFSRFKLCAQCQDVDGEALGLAEDEEWATY